MYRDVITSESKLHHIGHVDYVQNLPQEQQCMLSEAEIKYYIPWRAMWKQSSISTHRVEFDTFQITSTGYSLNNVMTQGKNNTNKLVKIALRSMTHQVAFPREIQKMCNSIKLRQEDWCTRDTFGN